MFPFHHHHYSAASTSPRSSVTRTPTRFHSSPSSRSEEAQQVVAAAATASSSAIARALCRQPQQQPSNVHPIVLSSPSSWLHRHQLLPPAVADSTLKQQQQQQVPRGSLPPPHSSSTEQQDLWLVWKQQQQYQHQESRINLESYHKRYCTAIGLDLLWPAPNTAAPFSPPGNRPAAATTTTTTTTTTRLVANSHTPEQQEQPAVVSTGRTTTNTVPGSPSSSSSSKRSIASVVEGVTEAKTARNVPKDDPQDPLSPQRKRLRHHEESRSSSNTTAPVLLEHESKENKKNDTKDHDDMSQLPHLRVRIRAYVDELIRGSQSAIPRQDAAAYLQAMAVDADLVHTGTDPLQFVRRCDFDLWTAAKRLCLYWTERLALFGPDRAFLPLTLTGTGALTEQDLLTLHPGFPALLPESAHHKQKTLLFDRRKWIPSQDSSTENKLRCLFYCITVLAQDSAAQVDGVLALAAVMTPRFPEWNFDWTHRASWLCTHAFPVRFHAHILNVVPRQKHPSIVRQAVQVVTSIIRKYALDPNYPIHVHTVQRGEKKEQMEEEEEPNAIVKTLLDLGLTRKEIPLLYGGEWRFEDFYKWCHERKEWEEEYYRDRLLPIDGSGSSTAITTNPLQQAGLWRTTVPLNGRSHSPHGGAPKATDCRYDSFTQEARTQTKGSPKSQGRIGQVKGGTSSLVVRTRAFARVVVASATSHSRAHGFLGGSKCRVTMSDERTSAAALLVLVSC